MGKPQVRAARRLTGLYGIIPGVWVEWDHSAHAYIIWSNGAGLIAHSAETAEQVIRRIARRVREAENAAIARS